MHDILLQAVDDSLKSVNLFYGGVADKQVGKYSGGMKRRLSVAISLIGDPKVPPLYLFVIFPMHNVNWHAQLMVLRFIRLYSWTSQALD
jgi:ABC-type Mn2+/Zn2+ transport system ATPase subunit